MNSSWVCLPSVTPWHNDQHLSPSFIHSFIHPPIKQWLGTFLLSARHDGWCWDPKDEQDKTYPWEDQSTTLNRLAYHPLHVAELPQKHWLTHLSITRPWHTVGGKYVNSVPDEKTFRWEIRRPRFDHSTSPWHSGLTFFVKKWGGCPCPMWSWDLLLYEWIF